MMSRKILNYFIINVQENWKLKVFLSGQNGVKSQFLTSLFFISKRKQIKSLSLNDISCVAINF